jgi:hypothetical protein
VGVRESAKVRRFYKTDGECKELEGGDWATKLTIGAIVRCIKKNLTYRVDWNDGTAISCNVSDHTAIAPEIDEKTSAGPTANATSETQLHPTGNGCVLFSFPLLSRVLYI